MTGIEQFMRNKVQVIENEIVRRLQYLLEECVNHARSLDTYKDQTGNLRSSIGGIILANGQLINTYGFEPKAGKVGAGREGTKEGLDFAKELANNHPTGFVLIVVAGMNYAKYVQAMGFDVTASAELIAKKEVPRMIKELKSIIKKVA